MIIADWVAVGVAVFAVILGLIVGFGKGLKFFTSGLFGFIISIVVCYFIFGLVLDWEFVQELLAKFVATVRAADNPFCDFLVKIRIEMVCYAIVLFIVVQLLRIIIVAILRGVVESDNTVCKVINRVLGVIFFVAVAVMLWLIAFQVIAWIGGNTRINFYNTLTDSVFKLDQLFLHNPLNSVFKL